MRVAIYFFFVLACISKAIADSPVDISASIEELQTDAFALKERSEGINGQPQLGIAAGLLYRQVLDLSDRISRSDAGVPIEYGVLIRAYSAKLTSITNAMTPADNASPVWVSESTATTKDILADLRASNEASKAALGIARAPMPLVQVAVHTYLDGKDFNGARIECTPRALKGSPPNLFVYDQMTSPVTSRSLPPGRYVFSAWSLDKRLDELEVPIGLEGQKTQAIDFPLKAKQ